MSKEFSWTDEQQDAISDRNKSLLVSASAGSGKTTVMIARIIELMTGVKAKRTPITNFLIVTFTKASATDMKKKLIDELLKLDADDYILEQIENVAIADISDLHSFYSKLISTYFYEVGIDPTYKIVDADASVLLKDRAISRLFEKKEKAGDVDYFRVYDIFQKKRQNTDLKETIFKFNDFLNSINDGKVWFKERLDEAYNLDLENNVCASLINNYVANSISRDVKVCENFADKCLKLGCNEMYDYFSKMADELKTVNKNNSYLVNSKNVYEISFEKAKKTPKEFDYLKPEAEKIKKHIKDSLKNYKTNFVSNDKDELVLGLSSVRNILEILFALTEEFDEIYSKLKKDINGLDFNDLEKYALKILENEAIKKAVQDKYKYVFVDEYQDINEVQEKIISLVSGKENRFMVGDIKQSIYRFRHCDPEIFISKSKEFSLEQNYAKLIKLNANFRSDKKILKFVDEVFSDVMTEDFGGVDYAKDSQFVAGKDNIDQPLAVNLCFIDTTKNAQEKTEASGVYSVKNHENVMEEETEKAVAEANYVASKIAELVNPLNEKAIKYSDIAILVQSRNEDTYRFLEVLRGFGIPIASDEKSDLMAKSYVQEIYNFIAYVCASHDDILLFKVLKSKLFNFTDDELVEIRKLNMGAKFYEVIDYFENLENEELKAKVKAFKEACLKYQKLAKIRSFAEIAKEVVKEFELYKINMLELEGEKINDEIDKFILRLPEKTAYEYLSDFQDLSMVFESEFSGDAVTVMTIHKSKGIEFKAVFVVGTRKKFNLRTTTETVVFNKKFGAGLDFFDELTRTRKPSVVNSAVKIYETRKLVEEQQRLLYVALTRAKEKLYVVCAKKKDDLVQEFPARPTSFINWFEPMIYNELDGKHNDIINFEDYSIFDLINIPSKEPEQLLLKLEDTEELKERVYENNASINIPLKNSVSKILYKNQNNYAEKDEDDESYENFRLSDEAVSSAKRGTAYHKLFQFIDLKNLQDISEAIDKAKANLSKEELEFIDEKVVYKVLELDFFKEIKATSVILKEREFYANLPAKIYKNEASENDEFIMQGVIDLLIFDGDEVILLDYKTGKLDDKKLENYTFQMNIYADVAEKAFNKKITHKLLCLIDMQKILEI